MATTAYWWNQLPEDFYAHADGTALDVEHPFKVRSTAAADRVLRSALGGVIAGSMLPLMASRKGMLEEVRRLDFYRDMAEQGDVAKTFVKPGEVRIEEKKPRFAHYRPWGIPAVDLSFKSPYEPINPAMRDHYSSFTRNQVAHAQHWRHADGPRKTLIFVHGVIEGWYGLNSLWFALKWFYKQGYDVLQFTLPFHGYRTEPRYGPSGVGFFAGGFSHLNEAMLHGVSDLRVLMDYLFEQGAPSVGVSGLSLGGYHSAMLATADPRLSFCVPNSPVVTPIDMALDWGVSGTALRWVMRKADVNVKELRGGLAIHSPLSYKPQIDTDGALIIGGAGDRLTSPRFVRLLSEHWQGSHAHWFPGNHVIHLHQGRYLRRMKHFMDRHTKSDMSS
ncbi:MAG: alpha/beta hydrolase family protein [Oceanococcus sp.]